MIAFLFPGQGSQYVGMAGRVVDPILTRRLFGQASDVLGLDLWNLVEAGDEATGCLGRQVTCLVLTYGTLSRQVTRRC